MNSKPLRICMIDDDPDERDLLQYALEEKHGIKSTMHQFYSLKPALEFLKKTESELDVVFLDCYLSGYAKASEVYENIRAVREASPYLPIILVSSKSFKQNHFIDQYHLGFISKQDYHLPSLFHILEEAQEFRTRALFDDSSFIDQLAKILEDGF